MSGILGRFERPDCLFWTGSEILGFLAGRFVFVFKVASSLGLLRLLLGCTVEADSCMGGVEDWNQMTRIQQIT